MQQRRVIRDPAVIIVLAYIAIVGIALLAWPSPERAWSSEVYLDLPVALFVVIVMARRTAALQLHREGNSFWAIVMGALISLLGASMVFAIDGGPSLPGKLFGDGLHALFYLGLLLAPEERPDHRPGWTEMSVSHRYWRLGAIVFVLTLVGYFVVVPAFMSSTTDDLLVPAFALFVALDAIIAARFFHLGRRASDPMWAFTYRCIGFAAACWCVLDVADGMYVARDVGPPRGTLLDLLYYLPHLAVLISVPASSPRIASASADVDSGNGLESGTTTRQFPAESRSATPRRSRVLLVEDDRAVRSITRRLLLDLAYDVVDVGTVDQARAIAHSGLDDIDVVVSDVRLLRSSGPEFVEELRAKRARLPAVFISGDPGHAIDLDRADTAFLAKPFARDALGRAIQDAMGTGAEGPRELTFDPVPKKSTLTPSRTIEVSL